MEGYKDLSFYKQTQIIHDFTMEFCQRYVDYKSRTKDQMEQAARSGKQNISEGYAQQDGRGRIKLIKIARGSQEELLTDYLDFLRQNRLSLWEKDDPRVKKIRSFVYQINKNYKVYNSYKDYNEAYGLYKSYLNTSEDAANAMVCLINQTNAMMNRKINWLEDNMSKEDALSPRDRWLFGQIRTGSDREREFDKEVEIVMDRLGSKKLPDGRFVKKSESEEL